MKLNRAEIVTIIATLVFLCFTIGFFTGRRSADGAVEVNAAPVYITPSASPVAATEDIPAEVSDDAQTTPTSSPNAAKPEISSSSPLNINNATVEELSELPGIGEVLAQRIVEYRNQNGNFKATSDLMDVYGIGEAKFEKIMELITV